MDRKPCNNGFYFMDSYLYKPVTMLFFINRLLLGIADCWEKEMSKQSSISFGPLLVAV